MLSRLALCFTLLTAPLSAIADPPRIIAAKADYSEMGWRIEVTLDHPDSGWDHYADGWDVLDARGNRIAIRKLMHPHLDEQPFTRSLRNVMVPDGVQTVYIRSRCSQDGWVKDTVAVTLRR